MSKKTGSNVKDKDILKEHQDVHKSIISMVEETYNKLQK